MQGEPHESHTTQFFRSIRYRASEQRQAAEAPTSFAARFWQLGLFAGRGLEAAATGDLDIAIEQIKDAAAAALNWYLALIAALYGEEMRKQLDMFESDLASELIEIEFDAHGTPTTKLPNCWRCEEDEICCVYPRARLREWKCLRCHWRFQHSVLESKLEEAVNA